MGFIQLCGTLQKSGMKIEYVSGICLTARRTTDQKRKRTVCYRMLGQIIIDDQNVLPFIHEIFAHGTAGIRRNILQRAGFGSRCRHNDGIIHGTVPCQIFHQRSHCGSFLADGHIDADHILPLLVNDGIRSYRCLSGLAIANDQLTLTSSDRDHGIDSLDAGLQRLMNRLAVADTRCIAFNGTELFRLDRAGSVDGLPKGIHDTADHLFADGNRNDLPGPLHGLAFTDGFPGTEENDGHAVLLQILCHTETAVFKFQQLAGHTVDQTAGTRDPVSYHQDSPGLVLPDRIIIIFDLAAYNLGYFFRF